MVQLFKYLLKANKKQVHAHLRGTFIDSLRLTVHGGHGGNGVPKYGGIGGQGGCVYFVATEGTTMQQVSRRWRENRISASSGEDGSKVRILGRRGQDERIEVPIGVQVLAENGCLLADLNEDLSTCIVAAGGIGGSVGTNFIGKPGQSQTVSLDLKLIADVGLVGFPNAGKSTLLKAVSNAKPKIASYPFTTIRPQIGVVSYPDLRSITVADLPGLIEGAHANFGMGHKFLKHIERTRLLLMLVDIHGFQLSTKHMQRCCLDTVYALNKELELYDNTLLDKPCVLLLNKMDLPGAKDILQKVLPTLKNLEIGLPNCPEEIKPINLLKFERIIPISAKNFDRVNRVKQSCRDILDNLAETQLLDRAEKVRTTLQHKLCERGPKVT